MPGNRKVLIVEDEVIVTDVVKRYFLGKEELKEIEIFYADTVDKALELLEKEKPTFVILDLSLKGSASETGFKIFNMYKDKVKIAVLSAYDDEMINCLNAGAVEYIAKPAKREEYLRLILTHA